MTSVETADYTNPEHRRLIIELLNCYAQSPAGGGLSLSPDVQRHLVDRMSRYSGAFSLIAYVDEQPAGLVNCFETLSTFKCKPLINIHDVITLEPFRRQGVATRMLSEVERIGKQRGCCKLTLEVLENNHPARLAYQKLGFMPYQLDPEFGIAQFWEKPLDH